MHQCCDKVVSFIPPEDIEPQAVEQLRNVASLPFIHRHVAVMPDCHLGKGATVGSVIATKGAIIPAAVGVDIGCVDADTEYLSPEGWRRIADYPTHGGRVMQYDHATGMGEFVQPENFVARKYPELLRIHTKYGIDQLLSPDHRMLVWKIEGRERRRIPIVLTAEEFEAEHSRLVQGFKAEIETTFTPRINIDDSGIPLTNEQIRIQVMVHADAHIERSQIAILHLKKDRKIQRARNLLIAGEIAWTEHTNADGILTIRFTPPASTKTYKEWWGATLSQLQVIADEIFHWDGNANERCYYSRDKDSADFMHYALTAVGFRAVMRADKHPRDGQIDYRVFAHANTRVGMSGVPKTPITREPSPDGKAYCFTLPSGFWVMRRGGNIAMTGNCGMIAVRTSFTASQLPDDLRKLHAGIERRIPLSAGGYNKEVSGTAVPRVKALAATAREHYAGLTRSGWEVQLGSLGSGNHFIEVSLDEADRVWIVLHSGSRGIGNQIAQYHIKAAQKLMSEMFITLPDRDLAYLPESVPGFQDYMDDLGWAQAFARLNREEMMDRVLTEFSYTLFGEDGHQREIECERINCHHNFTQREHHFRTDLWITRKGAIQMRRGQKGVIPGSMGTRSYIVSGLQNAISYHSAPHGAGRRMSRTAAKKQFSLVDLEAQMGNIVYRHSEKLIDEIPGAYKDIDEVMENARELVTIEHTLRQIVNVKGT